VRWNFRSAADVNAFWKKFQRVPARKRRTKRDEERYCLALYLLALATHRRLRYPLRIEEGESPDFMITWSLDTTTGIEITKATSMWEGAKDNRRGEWPVLVSRAIEAKLRNLESCGSDPELLVYDDRPLPMADRPKALSALHKRLVRVRDGNPSVGKVAVIISLGVAIDCGSHFQHLPFINWSDPSATRDFGERIEFEGLKASVTAVREHLSAGRFITYTDRRGRLMKQMPDGRRFEIADADCRKREGDLNTSEKIRVLH
jgi:hypothetical protein